MESHLCKTITLSEKMHEDNLSEEDDTYWALVKYAENVQECAVQLDKMELSILEALEEVPIKSEQGTDLDWSGLKGMRNKLSHCFWKIDREILWATVTKDFPVLRILLSLLIVAETPVDPDLPKFSLPVKKFRALPLSKLGDEFTLGNSFILMSFDRNGRAQCLRIARISETRLKFKPPGDVIVGEMSVYLSDADGENREHLGRRLY